MRILLQALKEAVHSVDVLFELLEHTGVCKRDGALGVDVTLHVDRVACWAPVTVRPGRAVSAPETCGAHDTCTQILVSARVR